MCYSRLMENKTIGKTRSLSDLRPEPYPEGNEDLSHEIDAVVYGT